MRELPTLSCPRCGSEMRPGQRFCADCGLALAQTCPNCGSPYEGNPKFCAECGASLALSQGADMAPVPTAQAGRTPADATLLNSERRFVTILFADLVGFTPLSEEHDAEEIRDLLSHYFDVARQTIEGYGGTVEKFIGDAVMAVWGAPVALEDDPERAVRAALELVDRVSELSIGGRALTLRVGVLSGEAAVRAGRSGEGMVAGDLVNTASRLQSVAPPGVVLVGGQTQAATSAAIAYEPAGDQLLKGKAAPVEAWRALRVVARVGGGGRDEGLEPPFVGRDEELRLLKDQLHAAERERKVRMVAITGQAGMGKSRLVWELEKYLDGLAGPILYYWHQGRSPSYGEGVAFWALGEMVRRRAGIAESEDSESTGRKLRSALDEFVPDADERRWLEPALGALLGIGEADWNQREQLFSAWRTLFERVAEKGPVVLVFEDIQWADSGLLDFIEHMLDWTRDKPLLLVTLARPEILERRPNFGVSHRAFAALHLEPLADAAMEALLRGLVPGLAADDLARIVSRAEGVPLYAVETVRALVDSGHLVRRGDVYEAVGVVPVLDIPPSLRALIASRLDALAPDDRHLVQDAAVIGLVFSVPTVAAISGRAPEEVEARLRFLSTRELVTLETDPRSPERGQYRFTQGLLREVAYGTLARRDRRVRHLVAARYFDTLGDDELAGVLASHYSEAYRAAPEGEEGAAIAAQARVALRAAAERASRLHSHEQALAYLEQALAVTFDEKDVIETQVQAARSAVALGQFDKAEAHARAALAWYEAEGDEVRAAEVAASIGQMLTLSSRIDEAMDFLTRTLGRLPDEQQISVAINGELARAHMFRDQPDLALSAVSRALDVAERTGLRAATTQLLITKSWALASLRRQREGTALLLGAMQVADDEDDLDARFRARFNLAGYLAMDDPRRGLQIAREGLAIAEQYGLAVEVANMAGNGAGCALLLGDLDEILRLEAGAGALDLPMAIGIRGYAAIVAALREDWPGVRERMALVSRAAEGSSSPQDVTWMKYQEALVALAAGNLEEARRLSRESRDAYFGADSPIAAVMATHIDALLGDSVGLAADRPYVAQNAILGAWLARGQRTADAAALALDGNIDEARAAYRRVIDDWRAADNKWDLALTLLERSRLVNPGDGESLAARSSAAELFAAMGVTGFVERLESAGPAPSASSVERRTPTQERAEAARR